MSEAVKFDNVSMRFMIQHNQPRSFQDALVNVIHQRNGSSEEFWALKNVSFEIQPGETLGIIGQNGSGKSTILKLITKILEPTSGQVTVDGKVSALIELGAGFHPDLSGRENIYLNGSIMGFSRKEMDRRFQEIVSFAELDQFIDTPVKHYSSGMYARLGFSVAVSVDPDILIVDEVLAVGDEGFQRKCFDRIAEFKRQGKTIILVSHGLQMVEFLCDRVVWLDHGVIGDQGPVLQTVRRYLSEMQRHDEDVRAVEHARGTATTAAAAMKTLPVKWEGTSALEIQLVAQDGREKYAWQTGEPMQMSIHFESMNTDVEHVLSFEIRRNDGLLVHRTTRFLDRLPSTGLRNRGVLALETSALPLLAGTYDIAVTLRTVDGPARNGMLPDAGPCRFSVWSKDSVEGIVSLPISWPLDFHNPRGVPFPTDKQPTAV